MACAWRSTYSATPPAWPEDKAGVEVEVIEGVEVEVIDGGDAGCGGDRWR